LKRRFDSDGPRRVELLGQSPNEHRQPFTDPGTDKECPRSKARRLSTGIFEVRSSANHLSFACVPNSTLQLSSVEGNCIRLPARQTTWQRRLNSLLGILSVKRSGIKRGVTTSSAAPVSERLRTVSRWHPRRTLSRRLSARGGAARCGVRRPWFEYAELRPFAKLKIRASEVGGGVWRVARSLC
jgi:hypothetical protein